MKRPAMLAAILLVASPAFGDDRSHDHTHRTDEVRQSQAIASLTEADIEQLRSGAGWGLALAAELNGVPGPAHLLELGSQIELEDEQVEQIQDLERDMRVNAIEEGERYIALEVELDRRFRERAIDEDILWELLSDIAESMGRLRYVHLATHLATLEILRPEQIDHYNTLRGHARD